MGTNAWTGAHMDNYLLNNHGQALTPWWQLVFSSFASHEFIREGNNVVVACSHQEKDVLVDCLFWQSLPWWPIPILSCRSHTSSSSRKDTTTVHGSSTRSCHNVKRYKNTNVAIHFYCAYYTHLFMKESWLWHVFLPRLDSCFNSDALQNAKQLFYISLPLMTKYCVMRECEKILCGYLYVCDLVFVILKGIYGFKFPKRFFGDLFQRSHFFSLFSILTV